MASNTAAWLTAAKARPFAIKSAALGIPQKGQILIRNRALAVNPIDTKIQALAYFPMNYPTILGLDVAGEVVTVGAGVTRFKKNDRVVGFAPGFSSKRNEEMGFQSYTVLDANMTSEIPDSVSYESAVVIPLGLSTAASGLFSSNMLNLQLPTVPAQKPTGKTLLVWGGASSVGINAIQMAVAAGYEVLTTASPKNFEFVKKFGASQVFDYNSSTVVADLLEAANGKTMAGAFAAVGGASWAPAAEFMEKADGVKLVVTTTRGFPDTPGAAVTILYAQSYWIRDNGVADPIWADFLPQALKAGTFVPAPEPLVAGTGLESLQGAVDLLSKGVSAKKVVVRL
ncbi:chaperonin 10-like protein [Xylariales sp. PMI_506]|nr:chaperonin 10-like protein [Xylariales sp. PMI_506]